MGYAGYSPGNQVADSLTPLQQALRSLPLDAAMDALDLIEKLTRNVVRNPSEDKFRSVKLTNAKVASMIERAPGIVEAMAEMGWKHEAEAMVLPAQVRLAHEVHVVGIIDARDYYKKEAENEKKRQLKAAKGDVGGEEVAELLKKMQQDRAEKAADGPVTQGSVARKLGEGGANIVRAADIGIGKSQGG